MFLFVGHRVAEGVGRRALLGRVGEASHAVEACLADEVFQLFEFLFALAGVADDKGGADGYVGQFGAELLEQAQGALAVDAALHGAEDAAVDVLQGDVDVVADVGVAHDGVDGVLGEGGGVGVVEAYPRGSAFGGEAFEQFAQGAAVVEVETIPCGVLADDQQLLDAAGDEGFGLGDDVVDGARAVGAADEGYGAVGAAAVASLGNLEVGVVGWGGEGPAFYSSNSIYSSYSIISS